MEELRGYDAWLMTEPEQVGDCPECDGKGWIEGWDDDHGRFAKTCNNCDEGMVIEDGEGQEQ